MADNSTLLRNFFKYHMIQSIDKAMAMTYGRDIMLN